MTSLDGMNGRSIQTLLRERLEVMSEIQAQSFDYFLNLPGPSYLVSMYLITCNFRDVFISRF